MMGITPNQQGQVTAAIRQLAEDLLETDEPGDFLKQEMQLILAIDPWLWLSDSVRQCLFCNCVMTTTQMRDIVIPSLLHNRTCWWQRMQREWHE
jgi:hypothetical protein